MHTRRSGFFVESTNSAVFAVMNELGGWLAGGGSPPWIEVDLLCALGVMLELTILGDLWKSASLGALDALLVSAMFVS